MLKIKMNFPQIYMTTCLQNLYDFDHPKRFMKLEVTIARKMLPKQAFTYKYIIYIAFSKNYIALL